MINKPISITLAEPENLYSAMIRCYFETHSDFVFSGHIRSYKELKKYSEWISTIMILGYNSLGNLGLKKVKELLENNASAKIICLLNYYDSELEKRLINLGVKAVFTMNDTSDSLREKILIAHFGGFRISNGSSNQLTSGYLNSREINSTSLLPIEKEIVRLIAEGKTESQISKLLGRSVRSVQSYSARIRSKVNCKNQKQLIAMAFDQGWNL